MYRHFAPDLHVSLFLWHLTFLTLKGLEFKEYKFKVLENDSGP